MRFGRFCAFFGFLAIKFTFKDILSDNKQRICRLLYLTNKLDLIEKILIFDQFMGQKVSKIPVIPYKGIRFLAIRQPFLD